VSDDSVPSKSINNSRSAVIASAPSEEVDVSNPEPIVSSNSSSIASDSGFPSNQPNKPDDLDDPEISFRSLNAEAKNLSSQFKNLSQGIVEVNSPHNGEIPHLETGEDNLSPNTLSSNPSYLISEETEPQPKVDISITRKRQSTEPNSAEDAKSSKTESLNMEYPKVKEPPMEYPKENEPPMEYSKENEPPMEFKKENEPSMGYHKENEPPKIIISAPTSPELGSQLLSNPQKGINKEKRSKSPPRLPEVTIFQDLVSKKVPKEVLDDEDDNDWRFEMHDEESKTAIFSWMKRSMFLVLHLGPRLEAKKTRKSIGKLVIHFPITKICLDTVRNINGQDYPGKIVPDLNRDLAQFSVIRKFNSSALHSMCPNTCSLTSVLKSISQYVTPANQFMDALDTVDDDHFPFKIANNVVTVGFVSLPLELAFDLTVDFNGGFKTAPERLSVKAVIGEPNIPWIEKIARMAQPGPYFIQEVASKIEKYVKEKEKAAAKKQTN